MGGVVVLGLLAGVGWVLVQLKPQKAGLQILTNNVGASIFLDGQYLDKTPYINKELKPGSYQLKIDPDHESLVTYETSVQLRAGLLTVVTWKPGTSPELSGGVVYELEKLSRGGPPELSIVSIPDGVVVSVDGGERDLAPVLFSQLSPGGHEIAISLPSYESQQHTINLVDGHRLNVLVKLAKNPLVSEISATNTASTSATVSSSPSPPLTSKSNSSSITGAAATSSSTTQLIGPQVKILPTNFWQNQQQVLRVRSQPSSQGAQLGFAQVGQSYPYANQTQNGWLAIQFNDQTGWVSGQFAQLNN